MTLPLNIMDGLVSVLVREARRAADKREAVYENSRDAAREPLDQTFPALS